MITGPIFSTPLTKAEKMEQAMEGANNINHRMKEQYTLRDKYFPYIESFLPKTEHLLFRHIAKYEDKYSDVLNSPYPLKTLPFGENEKGEDYDIVFRCTNINIEELRADIKKVPLPGDLKEKAAFLPLQVVLYLIIRYYTFTNQMKKAKVIYSYYGYSIYWKRFHRSFNKFPPIERVMIYTINEMSYRNLIKKLGSVKALLTYIVEHIFEYYREGLAESCDEDIRYILDQVQSDIGSKVNNIAQMYYKNHDANNEIYQSKTMLDDEGTQREDNSITATVESYAQRYTSKFFSETVNINRVKTAAAMTSEASPREVENTLEYIRNNASVSDIHEFYSAIFLYYLSLDDPKANADSIRSLKFIALMKDVIKKGNSINKNVTTIIKYANQWLEQGSNTFRLTSREGTKTNYRKAVYNYFILSVTNR
jgi:hypothetical protein